MLSFFLSSSIVAQQTIWEETFSYDEGTVTGQGSTGEATWEADGMEEYSNDNFHGIGVVNNQIHASNAYYTNPPNDTWRIIDSDPIEITGFTNVEISMDISTKDHQTWDVNNMDSVLVQYKLDNGSWTYFTTNGRIIGDVTNQESKQTGLLGDELWLRVRVNSDLNWKHAYIDNIKVKGTATSPPPCTTLNFPSDDKSFVPVGTYLDWNSVAGAEGYLLYLGTDASATNIENGTDLGNVSSYTPSGDLTPGTDYYWKVVPYNSIGNASGCSTWHFTTDPYCATSGTFADRIYISNVKFNTIDNTTGVDDGYGDYTSISTTLSKGASYTLSITEENTWWDPKMYMYAWIDWNQDGDFTDSDESYYLGQKKGTLTTSITVPTTATEGDAKLRIIISTTTITSACATGYNGEAEDYSITIPQPASPDFITTWKTDNAGTSNSTSITIPATGTYEVDWDNDGTFDETVTGSATHDFGTAGTYTIRMRGGLESINFNDAGDVLKILSIKNWGTIAWDGTWEGAYHGCANLNINAPDAPDLSNIRSMRKAFTGCISLNADLSQWDVSTITNMYKLFDNASAFNGDISTWNTGMVENMSFMFRDASAFNQDLNSWNTGNVTTMEQMFDNASIFNGNISNWNTSNVTTMDKMFRDASAFNKDLTNWNTARVTTMKYMFDNASAFNGDMSNWNTAKVTDMSYMFRDASAFNQDLNSWSTKKVIDMSYMFDNASAFNSNISNWNTMKVEDMSYMFDKATAFNTNISNWNTVSVANMTHMFREASSFNQDLNSWNTTKVTDMSYMFDKATAFDGNISNWSTVNVTTMKNMFQEASAFNQNLNAWNTASVTTMKYMFYLASAFNGDISNWNTAEVTDMSFMFQDATSFDQDLGSWNTAKVTTMKYMFSNSSSFNQDLRSWNTASVTTMKNMFDDAILFNQNIGNWDVSSLDDAEKMLDDCAMNELNYDSLLIGWNKQTLKPNVELGAKNLLFCKGRFARANMISNDGWVFSRDSRTCNIDDVLTDSVTTITNTTARLYATITEGENLVEYGFHYAYDTIQLMNGGASVIKIYDNPALPKYVITESYEATIPDLQTRKGCYFRAYVKNDADVYHYGDVIRFLSEKRDFSLALDGNGDALALDYGSTDTIINNWGSAGVTFSVDFWIKRGDLTAGEKIICYNKYNGGYVIMLNDGVLVVENSAGVRMSSNFVIDDLSWHHVAITYDNRDCNIYVNDNATYQNIEITKPVFVNNVSRYYPYCIIGAGLANNQGATNSLVNEFYGHLDAMRFWNAELTADQVSELANDNLNEGQVANTVEGIASGEVMPSSLKWENLNASLGFNVMSSYEDSYDFPSDFAYDDQSQYHDYPFFHNNARLADDNVNFNILAIGDAKPSIYLPRVHWRSNPADSEWTTSDNWGGYAYPGQGITQTEIDNSTYADVSTVAIDNDSVYCKYTVINSSNTQPIITTTPPEVQVLVDRDANIGTYRVNNATTSKLTVLQHITDSIFSNKVLNKESSTIIIDEGAVEVE